ncbi:MAG: hypothetical protein LBO79_04435 [Zoogloeaceae bacterium]|jgi:hypothetical protein|nr:hypothetical protein [Zoogloeaceae bacterium]
MKSVTSRPLASTANSAPAGDGLLVWRTRESSRHLLLAMVYSLGIAVATGVLLLLPLENEHLTLVALVTHLVAGVLAFVFFVPFLFIHLKDGRESLLSLFLPWRLLRRVYRGETLYHRLLGYLLMWCLWIVFASGLVIAFPAIAYLAGRPMTLLPYGGHAALLRIHLGVSGFLLVVLLLHFPKRVLS